MADPIAVHGDPLPRRLARGAVRPLRAADDVRALAEHGRWLARPVTTGRRIAVTGIRGGSGKSTVAALVATVLARHRRDRVLALDADPQFGSLPLRLACRRARRWPTWRAVRWPRRRSPRSNRGWCGRRRGCGRCRGRAARWPTAAWTPACTPRRGSRSAGSSA
ncbi:AAA family ATPase [Actinomadura sp. CNU-125]|uniref:nucleotide-binding protein n=1 Tax=Actinomadura sp. CNU-125 TaxID=1904961 RepID=UPI0013018190|nr:AAA family ATPase [Actinomadura sp. CNU-125]